MYRFLLVGPSLFRAVQKLTGTLICMVSYDICLTFSNQNHFFFIGADGLVKLWTVKTNECIATYDQHEDKVLFDPASCCNIF